MLNDSSEDPTRKSSFDAANSQPAGSSGGPALSLPGLLNILYQGRRVILAVTILGILAGLGYSFLTEPLYRATAQIRPGIVSYSEQGGPVREWALKDVVRWFRTGMFWQDLRDQEQFSHFQGAPDIIAEFIPSGPQFMMGGDVITLSNLSSDPLIAVATLDEAIHSFNRQASMDSLGSTMYLTIGGARVRMAKIAQDIEQLAADEERVKLAIEQEKRALTLVEFQDQKLSMDLERLTSEQEWRRKAVVATKKATEAAKTRLTDADTMLAQLIALENIDPGVSRLPTDDPVRDVLWQTVRRDQAGQVGALLEIVNELSSAIFEGEVKADSLATRVKSIGLEIRSVELEREVALAKKRADIQQKIQDLEIQLSHDLPHQKTQLKNDWQAEKVRLDLLSPVERIGRITISEKPVRPRKLRATSILTILAFVASLFLVLALRYFQNNREAIFAGKRV